MLCFDDWNEDEGMVPVAETQDLGSSHNLPIKKGKRPRASHFIWGGGKDGGRLVKRVSEVFPYDK